MKIFKNIFLSIFILFILINNSWSKSASEFITLLSAEASDILSSKLSDEEKITRLKKIGEQSVDIKGVGLYTLGKYRKTLSDNQKKQYEELFKDYFLNMQKWTREHDIPIYYFSSFDESWKVGAEEDVGAFWGLWDKAEQLKF